MKVFQSLLLFLGRVAISLVFFVAAYHKITHWDPTMQEMATRGIGQTPIFLFLACIIEFFGGISLVLGFMTRWGAAILALFLIPVTLLFHNFWSFGGPEENLQFIMFLKNAAIFGGLLFVSVTGPGLFAIDKK
ncbi:MAG: Inner membrane protein YqjF [Chlamydiae bacterium]|nr:Inner membrane protein YqjF [Chlamydiota bacterium]